MIVGSVEADIFAYIRIILLYLKDNSKIHYDNKDTIQEVFRIHHELQIC